MLRIRPEQLRALREPLLDDFAERMVTFLRDQFANAAAQTPDALHPQTRGRVDEALACGLTTDRELATYVTAAWLYGDALAAEVERAGVSLASPSVPTMDKHHQLRVLIKRRTG